jgi:hypothetical protein
MKAKHGFSGKIVNHGGGLGAPTPELVLERARELAAIAGHEEVRPEDWTQAKRELHGGHVEGAGPEVDGMVEVSWDGEVGSLGHRVVREGEGGDEGTVGEELVAEGMDEAVHEQMLAAARMARREER